MRGLNLIPADVNLGFISKKPLFYVFSGVLVAASIGLFAFKGLNYGIDFKGGIMIEAQTPEPADIGALRNTLTTLNLGEVSLQEFGAANDVLINLQRQEGDEKAQQAAVQKIKEVLGDKVEYRRVEFVGPKVSEELFWSGLYALSLSFAAILAYVWFRFEWQFGVCAVIALAHDVISTIGLFSLLGMEFNLTTVAAVLTITGYSINDTVVVFDRVREYLRKFKTMPMPELLNASINSTLSRTTMTSGTTLLALAALYLFGGEVIRGFSIAMIWGIVIGTYSSICLAAPLLLHLSVVRRGAGGRTGEAATEPTP